MTHGASGKGSGLGSGVHHDTLPLGHQDETFREDRVPRRLPGSPGERLPCADNPSLDVFRWLTEGGRRSRLRPNDYRVN